MTDADQLIRATVRIQQLESAINDIGFIVDTELFDIAGLDGRAFEAARSIEAICQGVRPVPPPPATEAHIMRDLQAAEDDI